MRASSVSLEIFVEILPDELIRLKRKPLRGTLKFMDWFSIPDIKKNIPLTIGYNSEQKDSVFVKQEPENVYLGQADRLRFNINSDYYDSLVSNNVSVDRFEHSGKLRILVRR